MTLRQLFCRCRWQTETRGWLRRDRLDGAPVLTCDRCGRVQPLITRSTSEAAQVRGGALCGELRAKRVGSEPVKPLKFRKGGRK